MRPIQAIRQAKQNKITQRQRQQPLRQQQQQIPTISMKAKWLS